MQNVLEEFCFHGQKWDGSWILKYLVNAQEKVVVIVVICWYVSYLTTSGCTLFFLNRFQNLISSIAGYVKFYSLFGQIPLRALL